MTSALMVNAPHPSPQLKDASYAPDTLIIILTQHFILMMKILVYILKTKIQRTLIVTKIR